METNFFYLQSFCSFFHKLFHIRVKVGDVITIRDKSKNSVKFKEILDKTSGRLSPKWLEVNKDEYTAKVVALPSLEDIDYEVAPHLIVELYSK